MFEKNDVPINPNKLTPETRVEDINVGIEEDPKIIKLSKGVLEGHRERYVQLFYSYKDVFAWSYQDLKNFDISII